MKSLVSMLMLSVLLSVSCSKKDNPTPNFEENSFSMKIDGQIYQPEGYDRFLNESLGIFVYYNKKDWLLEFNNKENERVYIFLKEVTGTGAYKIGQMDGDFSFATPSDTVSAMGISDKTGNFNNVAYQSTSEYNQYINIHEVVNDSILVGSFEELTLVDPNDKLSTVQLTEGKFNINLKTLNKD